jgi:ATP-dependent DNA helicase RecG
MAISVSAISLDQRARILSQEESHFLDLKAIEIAPARLTRSISAFANADGGELFIGIDEDKVKNTRKWRGFVDQEAANGHLQAFEALFPLGVDFDYELFGSPTDPTLLMHATIRKTKDIKRASDGIPYLRIGAQNLPVDTEAALARLKQNKGITSFETSALSVPIDRVTNSEVIIGFMLEIIPTAEPEAWLKKQLLITEDKPTVAGVLLFSDEPQAILPKRSAIKIYRYTTTEEEGSRETLAFDPITIEGCLYDQVQRAVATTQELIEGVQVLGPEGLEKVQYPKETLHEIITNAVLHRDYSIADDVHVRIFDNRVEVESPGRLPAHVTVANILEERFARNGQIVRIINKFPNPPNKDVGEGLNTAFAAMKKLKLQEPQIQESSNAVNVNIRHQRLGTPEELILEYLGDHEEITNKVVRELTGIGSENKVKTIFNGLIKAGQIKRVPDKGGPASAYRLPVK